MHDKQLIKLKNWSFNSNIYVITNTTMWTFNIDHNQKDESTFFIYTKILGIDLYGQQTEKF